MSLLNVLAAGMLMSTMAQQGGAAPRVAVVNLAQVFDRYLMVHDLEQMFEERRNNVTAQAQKKRDDLNTQRAALEQFKPGSPDYTEREEQLGKDEFQFQWWLERQERVLKEEHKAWLISIYRQVEAAVAAISQSEGIDLVLTYNDLDTNAPDSIAFRQQILLRPVIYANGRVNLTNAVIESLDSQYQKQGGASKLQLGKPPTGGAGRGQGVGSGAGGAGSGQ